MVKLNNNNINIKLLMNLGAHIGHAKIDWNTKVNMYLAGETNNNYLIFNINKTFFFFKRALLFMNLIGYNKGKFIIYYPGNNNFYKKLMEASLDKDGLLPTKYPFVHSFVKPGFFSNWKINYKQFIKQFYKIIFWNPYFFASLATQHFYNKLDTNILYKISNNNLKLHNKLKVLKKYKLYSYTKLIKNLFLYKKVNKSHFKFYNKFFFFKKKNLLYKYKYNYKKNLKKIIKKNINNKNKFFIIDIFNKFQNYDILFITLINHGFFSFNVSSYGTNFFKSLFIYNESFYYYSESGISCYRYDHWILHTLKLKKKDIKFNYIYFFLKNKCKIKMHFVCEIYKRFKINYQNRIKLIKLRKSLIAQILDYINYYFVGIWFIIDEFIFIKRNTPYDVFMRLFYKYSTRQYNLLIFIVINFFLFLKKLLSIIKCIKNKIKYSLNSSNPRSIFFFYLKKKNIKYFFNKSKKMKKNNNLRYKGLYLKRKKKFRFNVNNYNLLNMYPIYKDNKEQFYYPKELKLPLNTSKHKISTFLNKYILKNQMNNFYKKIEYKNKFNRINGFKLFYYNMYNLLINISTDKYKYKKKNKDELGSIELKLFRRFLRFSIIFRYLKKIMNLPSTVILLNSDLHESQQSDFQNLRLPVIGLVDTNSSFKSLSYFIPTNDDSIILFLYYIKMLSYSYVNGIKYNILNNVAPKLSQNFFNSRNKLYKTPFYNYQYKNNTDIIRFLGRNNSLFNSRLNKFQVPFGSYYEYNKNEDFNIFKTNQQICKKLKIFYKKKKEFEALQRKKYKILQKKKYKFLKKKKYKILQKDKLINLNKKKNINKINSKFYLKSNFKTKNDK